MTTEGPFIDYYAVLEIQFGASTEEIRKAWMQLVKQWQSKANSGDSDATERLQQIHEAYEVLSDPSERAEYDHAYEYYKQHLEEERRRQEEAERQRRDAEQRKQREDQRRQQEEQARRERERREEDQARRECEKQEQLKRETEWLNEQEIERLIREAEKKQRLEQERKALESIKAEVSLHEAKRRLEHDRYERRKEIAIIIAIVVLIIAGVAGIAALTWFVIIPFFVNLVTTIWNWIVNTLIPLIVVIGLFAGIMWLMIRASPRER